MRPLATHSLIRLFAIHETAGLTYSDKDHYYLPEWCYADYERHLAAAAIGLGLAIASAIQVNYALPFLPMCTSGSCQQALRSEFSQAAGVPLSVLDYTVLTDKGNSLTMLRQNRTAFDQLGLSATPTIINYDASGSVQVSKLRFV